MPIGDICWADLPGSDRFEQAGRRPVLILQDDGYARSLPTTIVVPITSQRSALRLPGTVSIAATPANGLAVPSVLLVFQVRALDRLRLDRLIGRGEPAIVSQVYDELDRLIGRSRPPPPPLSPPSPPAPPPPITQGQRVVDI